MAEDTITAPAATPAPVAVADQTPAPVVAAPATAPVETPTNDGKPVEGATDTPKTGKDGLPGGVKKRLWEQAEKIRKYEAEIERLKLTTSPPPPAAPPVPGLPATDVNLLDDPEKWAKSVEGRITSNAEKQILSRIEQAATEKRIAVEAQKAQEFILSHPEFEGEEAMNEIQSIVASPEVQAVCSQSPMKGAEYAVYLFNKAKGLDKASVDKAKDNAAKSGAPLPAGVQASGKKVWTPAEIGTYLKDWKHPDFKKRQDEVLLAQKEGRIKV
jgi:hypothetical protein